MTNTYSEARSWIDENKDKFEEELNVVADKLERSHEEKENPRWQSDPEFFKWRLFTDTFTPQMDNERCKLVQMALSMFKRDNQRSSHAHSSDTLHSLHDELKAFLNAVAKLARNYINEDVRNLNLLSYDAEIEAAA